MHGTRPPSTVHKMMKLSRPVHATILTLLLLACHRFQLSDCAKPSSSTPREKKAAVFPSAHRHDAEDDAHLPGAADGWRRRREDQRRCCQRGTVVRCDDTSAAGQGGGSRWVGAVAAAEDRSAPAGCAAAAALEVAEAVSCSCIRSGIRHGRSRAVVPLARCARKLPATVEALASMCLV